MAYLMLGIVMIFLSIVFRLAAVFRLTIPLLYALVVPTVFHEWYYANQTLANVIWYVLLAVVLGLSLGKQKDIGVLLTMAVCCMVAMIAISYLEPVLDFLRELETLGDLQGDMLGILLKAVGIGLVSEIAGLVCTDAGNGSLGKTLQMLGSAVILYLSLPIFTAMLELIREILREL